MQIKDLILFKLIMVATDYYDEEGILERIDFDEDVEYMCEAESVVGI